MKASDVNSRTAPIIGAVEILNVRLKAATFSSTISGPDDLPGRPVLTIEHRAYAADRREDGSFSVIAEMAALVRGENQADSEPAVVVRATFEVGYALPPEVQVQQEALDAFAQVNGTFNAWPYWREFVHSSLVRMGLPAIQLPVLRGLPRALSDEPIGPHQPAALEKSSISDRK